MSRIPSLNRFLFTFYAIFTVGLFLLSFVSPGVQGATSSPMTLFRPDPIEINVWYSSEKEDWLAEVIPAFQESSEYRVNGRPVTISLRRMGSREMYLAVLEEGREAQPALISPASSLQISILQNLSVGEFGRAIVNPANQDTCRSVVETPLVLAGWRERATALWGTTAPDQLWQELHDALVNPQGWQAYGHPEWGFVKLGHTSPLSSNSGFMTILLMTYGYHNKTSNLVADDILGNRDYQQWLIDMENAVSDFGDSTGTYMSTIISRGPSAYDMVAVYEATVISQIENAAQRGYDGELQVYYPPATVMSDHPFCILDADWVTSEQAAAAQEFIQYLETEEVQQIALLNHGFRPTNSSVSLTQAGSPFNIYAPNGLSVSVPPEVEVPDGAVLDTLLEFWARNIQ